ncbi:hypothetical protein B0H13DRAFT_2368316 [Mycena leptocephala]|nr:hypothetical protein B0H13DRAFT_2368316 [Mycena leptocephala]
MPACGPNPRKNDFIERFFPHSLGTPSRGLSSRFGRQPENASTRDAVIAGQSLDICMVHAMFLRWDHIVQSPRRLLLSIVTATTNLNWPAVSTGQNLFDRALADGSLETGVEPAYINGDANAGASSALNTWAKDEEIHDDLDPEEGT